MQIVVPDEFKYLYVKDQDHPVVKIPDNVLRETAMAIPKLTKRHFAIAENMLRIMKKAYGIGLAAPQLGILERVIVMAPEGRTMVLFNPEIVMRDGMIWGEEGCLSIPGLYGEVERPESVRVKALDRKGREVEYDMEGTAARVVQHEIDHLDGILFIDKVNPATLHWIHPYPDDPRNE